METGALLALGGAAALLLIVLAALLGTMLHTCRQLQKALDESRADVALLAARLDELQEARATADTPTSPSVVPTTEYLITTAGAPAEPVSNRVVLSATLGEPLVKALSFGYGLRRALAPETRNRILFEMRREVKRSRKQRRRDARDAVRQARREATA